ncbi:MAG: hypothetical protein L0H93_04645 [Nocardioides sp.]|nr:hypothetical protein [Nocardioides sp.]
MRSRGGCGMLTGMYDHELLGDLREAVHRFRTGERRRRFPPMLHVGDLTGTPTTWLVGPGDRLDAGLRTDIVAELLDSVLHQVGATVPSAWLTRSGAPLPHDEDAAWMGPIDRAFEAALVTPRCMVVVTKGGWYQPHGVQRREWKRLRIRPQLGPT